MRMQVTLLLWVAGLTAGSVGGAAENVLARSHALYASLSSYEDTGEVVDEYGSAANPSRDRHTFTTYFNRKPRGFAFDFRKAGGDRYVIWGDPDAFHTWWRTTGGVDHYPNPSNIGAFTGSGYHTFSSATMIAPLLYGSSALSGDVAGLTDAVSEGAKDVSGHRCARFSGTLHDTYAATGREVNTRKVSVCIDPQSLLVLEVVEEWPPLPGQVRRITVTFQPHANSSVGTEHFRFTPPTGK
jgi:hypothetical protein